MRALDRDIERRFQTADEFRDALDTYLVSERIVVPAAGVKGLLRRVLGSKIDQRRQQIRSAIRALDGAQTALTLVSEEPIVAAEEPISVSVSSADAISQPSGSSRSGLGAAFLPGDGSSGVQTLSQPSGPPARTSRFLMVGAALGAVVAGAAFMLLGPRHEGPQVHEGPINPASGASHPGSAAPAQPVAPLPTAATLGTSGTSIDTLPEVGDTVDPAAPRRAPGPVPPTNQERIAKDMAALRAEPSAHADPAKVTLAEEANSVQDIANGVSLDDHSQAADPERAPSSHGDFDKSAAAAALGRAAGMAGVCSRPGGDTGPGKALITIAPNGRVQSVNVQGKFAGTPVGDCIATQFRTVKVPAFTGDPVTVGKSFVIPD
jgi:hypothetical protein